MANRLAILPATPGSCAVCATDHDEDMPHNYWSLFYQVRFTLRHDRCATHADTVAHLSAKARRIARGAMNDILASHGVQWTEPDGDAIAEPYAISEGNAWRTTIDRHVFCFDDDVSRTYVIAKDADEASAIYDSVMGELGCIEDCSLRELPADTEIRVGDDLGDGSSESLTAAQWIARKMHSCFLGTTLDA